MGGILAFSFLLKPKIQKTILLRKNGMKFIYLLTPLIVNFKPIVFSVVYCTYAHNNDEL